MSLVTFIFVGVIIFGGVLIWLIRREGKRIGDGKKKRIR